ncbi:hypothetical protein F2Q69_00029971 [Brassica cretica]|uniref:Uncharacterized protein n=1 Tax=Brassica cretica TaxID=69181 RepID=A0A8S9RTN5_BRACR|nr:hypothetical protein F2Q69_00029971 [Brassica cretica]
MKRQSIDGSEVLSIDMELVSCRYAEQSSTRILFCYSNAATVSIDFFAAVSIDLFATVSIDLFATVSIDFLARVTILDPFSLDRIRAACALPPGVNRATLVALVAHVRPKRGKKEKEVLLDRPDESSEAGSLERARKVQWGWVLRPRSQAQSPGLLARPVSIAIPSGGAREAPDTSASSAGDRALNDEIDSSSHRSQRRVLEEINSVPPGSSSPRLSPPLRAAGEGSSEPSGSFAVRWRTVLTRSGQSVGTLGSDQTDQKGKTMVYLGFHSIKVSSGLTISLGLASWSGKTSSGTVGSVIWTWLQP